MLCAPLLVHGESLLWIEHGKPTAQAEQLLQLLATAPERGLASEDYRLPLDAHELQQLQSGQAAAPAQQRFDAELTRAATRFISDVRFGRIDARAAGFDLPAKRSTRSLETALQQVARSADVSAALAELEPRPPPYRMLVRALRTYRQLAARPELTRLPAFTVRSLQPGMEYSGAQQLRNLLAALGDLPPEAAAAHLDEKQIDAALGAAVATFQSRHGLAADSVIGKRTFAELTTPLQQRVQQLELTLERWRWLTALGRPDIVVNIPQFTLYALPRGDHRRGTPLQMPIVVGRSELQLQTPIFATSIREVVFQPYWDVPQSILHTELLPLLQRDPAYAARHHLQIVRGATDAAEVLPIDAASIRSLASGRLRLRQEPGPHNALGPVKFVMPNRYSVYLHGTPEQALFQRAQRAFSHGCIRVSDPAALAAYVLVDADGDWNAAAIANALTASTTRRIVLRRPIPVVVLYTTAAVSEAQGVRFYPDVYGHDRALATLLAEQTRTRRQSAAAAQ